MTQPWTHLPQAGKTRNWCLRPARETDLPVLLEIYRATRAPEFAALSADARLLQTILDQQFEAQRRHYQAAWPAARQFIVEAEQQAIGQLYLNYAADALHLIDIALLPSQRGQGLGEALLQWVIAQAQQAGVPVNLRVRRDNVAQRLYLRMGFQVVEDDGLDLLMSRPQVG